LKYLILLEVKRGRRMRNDVAEKKSSSS